ncbi:MAG: hypothetical protein KAS66_05150 [Candidatus Omnitrophica bacterium]|nr:hypothetical protein [Candidatus Omnitrophota bacterium]
MANKFTQGPWEVYGKIKMVGDLDSVEGAHNHWCGKVNKDGNEYTDDICSIQSSNHVEGGIGIQESEANAHLISAAPEMLEALIYAYNDPDICLTHSACKMFDAVIGKARGKENG